LQQRLFATRRTQINDSLHIRYIETPPTSLR
jgi:hypothetical protein